MAITVLRVKRKATETPPADLGEQEACLASSLCSVVLTRKACAVVDGSQDRPQKRQAAGGGLAEQLAGLDVGQQQPAANLQRFHLVTTLAAAGPQTAAAQELLQAAAADRALQPDVGRVPDTEAAQSSDTQQARFRVYHLLSEHGTLVQTERCVGAQAGHTMQLAQETASSLQAC